VRSWSCGSRAPDATRTLAVMERDPEVEQDRDLTDLEALERELAVLERELETVDGSADE
jgi:hypothetical protein